MWLNRFTEGMSRLLTCRRHCGYVLPNTLIKTSLCVSLFQDKTLQGLMNWEMTDVSALVVVEEGLNWRIRNNI